VRLARVLGAGVALGAVILITWACWLEPAALRVRTETLRIPRWPASLAGMRVALLAGDYVIKGVLGGRFVPPEATAAVLRGLTAPLGVYAVLGNHDWWFDAPRVRRALEASGIPVLDDRAMRISARGGDFWLAGVSDFWEGRHAVTGTLAQVSDDAPVILFTHNPDIFPTVPPRVAITLAGHTHGGQVCLPLIGRPLVPSRYGQRYAIGHVVEGARHLFVTAGLGTSIVPIRFRVPPEISILDLLPDSNQRRPD
jgi:predicted MPP superfamily phosphohydrolase